MTILLQLLAELGIATGLARAIMAWGRSGVMSSTADRESSTNVPMDVVARYVREKSKKAPRNSPAGYRTSNFADTFTLAALAYPDLTTCSTNPSRFHTSYRLHVRSLLRRVR